METPQQKTDNLAKKLGLKTDLFLKREDLHPFGSHKGRSIPKMIEKYAKEGQSSFVISSSGNAALAATYGVIKYNEENENKLHLQIFVGKNIEKEKLKNLETVIEDNKNIQIEEVERPKQTAFLLEKEGKAKFLRQSTDDLALKGYHDLAKELSEIENLQAVFVPTSSGTTAQGLYEGFKELNLNPEIYIVQTQSCHPMVEKEMETNERSIAGAIVDKVAHRKKQVQSVLKESSGKGFVATNEEIKEAMEMVKDEEDLDISPNSALSIAGLTKALKTGAEFNGPVVCLVTGR